MILKGIHSIIVVGLLAIILGCSTIPKKKDIDIFDLSDVVIRIESEIPIRVTVYKSCEGNWNFCEYN